MPLSPAAARREIHQRVIDMKAYAREDGLYDVEAHLVDRKPFPFKRIIRPDPLPAGAPLHDLWVRLTVDNEYLVRGVEAASDVTPYDICKEAEGTLQVLVGEKLVSGWSSKVKERLHGTASCTHLKELLLPLATTALQGIRGLQADRKFQTRADGGTPAMLDTCYAYASHRAVVKQLWPLYFRPHGDLD